MNIFFLDYTPEDSAKAYMNKHLYSGMLEIPSMLALAFDNGTFKPWKWLNHQNKFYNHPMSKWVRSSIEAYDWTLRHGFAVAQEYTFRFNKTHKCLEYLNYIAANIPMKNLSNSKLEDPPHCFGSFKDKIEDFPDIVRAYREYYILAKQHLANWKPRNQPEWYRFINNRDEVHDIQNQTQYRVGI